MSFCLWRSPLAAGLLLGAILLRRPLVDGHPGRFVPAAGALVLRQHAAADGRYPGRILFCRGRAIGSGGCCVSLGFVLARLVVRWLTGSPVKPDRPAPEASYAP